MANMQDDARRLLGKQGKLPAQPQRVSMADETQSAAQGLMRVKQDQAPAALRYPGLQRSASIGRDVQCIQLSTPHFCEKCQAPASTITRVAGGDWHVVCANHGQPPLERAAAPTMPIRLAGDPQQDRSGALIARARSAGIPMERLTSVTRQCEMTPGCPYKATWRASGVYICDKCLPWRPK